MHTGFCEQVGSVDIICEHMVLRHSSELALSKYFDKEGNKMFGPVKVSTSFVDFRVRLLRASKDLIDHDGIVYVACG